MQITSMGVPTQVELQVKNGNSVVARQVVNSSNKAGDDENTWSYTFTGLTKYDSQGQPINYTVDETEVTPGDLDYYSKNISGNTITNTYNGPIISGKKEVKTGKRFKLCSRRRKNNIYNHSQE